MTAFKISLVIGIPFAAIGAIALASLLITQAGPLTSTFQSVSEWTHIAAAKLTSDPLTLSAFVSSVGGALVLTGVLGMFVEKWKQLSLDDSLSPHHQRPIEALPAQPDYHSSGPRDEDL